MADKTDDLNEGAEDNQFRLSRDELATLKRFALELRSRLVNADVRFIRSAAPAILAIERLPKPTPGVRVTFGYRTPRIDGNYGWADIVLSEEERGFGWRALL